MIRESWRNDSPSSAAEARDRLIDATEACFARFGVVKTTLEDIATEAGVSRATVYRYFGGGRDEIVLGVVLREAAAFLGDLDRVVKKQTCLEDVIVEGVLYTVASVRSGENISLLFAPEVAGQTTAIAGGSSALFHLTSEFLRPIFEEASADGELREGVVAEDAAEFVVRIILSLLSVAGPEPRSAARERELVRTFCAGAIVRR